jgi:glycerol-3-phosphate dehydrogenase (NAD(P)+)
MCALSGPNIAAEMARRLPASMVAASADESCASHVQDLLRVPWLRVYRHDDVIGVEVTGATKNVIAMAAGMVDGLGAGNNAKSALLARGLAEIARLGVAMGARLDTFFGVAHWPTYGNPTWAFAHLSQYLISFLANARNFIH